MSARLRADVVAALLGAMASGCTLITDSFLTNDFSGDPYPINVDTTTGAIIVGIHAAGSDPGDDPDAVLDLLSPITVIDPGPMMTPAISFADLTLLGEATPGSTTRVPRARFVESQLVALHPCDASDANADGTCHIGEPSMPRTFQGILGADSLAGDAVRLRLGDDQIFVLADVGGSDRGRSLDCDAVFDSPYRGGGTLVFPTTELPFGNRRITLQACLGQNPPPDPKADLRTFRQHGTDALFVVSTSIGISILGQTAYERYRLANPEANAPDLASLPMGSVYLPSYLVTGHRAVIDRLALVATSTSNALSPCRQVYAHRLQSLTGPLDYSSQCAKEGENTPDKYDCPCKDHSDFCATPAILELAPPQDVPMPLAGIDVLVVDDDDPTLQALRTELRPDQPEVDGILGTGVLRGAEIDVDYPHDRLVARCRSSSCIARPELAQDNDRCQINRCILGAQIIQTDPGLFGCPTPPD